MGEGARGCREGRGKAGGDEGEGRGGSDGRRRGWTDREMEEREGEQTMKENKKNGTVEVDMVGGWVGLCKGAGLMRRRNGGEGASGGTLRESSSFVISRFPIGPSCCLEKNPGRKQARRGQKAAIVASESDWERHRLARCWCTSSTGSIP